MKNFRVPTWVVVAGGLGMLYCGNKLPLHQGDMDDQTLGEFILYGILNSGGILLVLIAAFGIGRSSGK